MLVISFYFLAFLLALWILEKIPGVNYLAKPILNAITSTSHFLTVHGAFWLLWLLKTVYFSHITIIKHLFTRRIVLNQSEAAVKRRKSI